MAAFNINDSFTVEQWDLVVKAPLAAGSAVALSGKSGPIQIAQEAFTLHTALAATLENSPSGLVMAVVSRLEGMEPGDLETALGGGPSLTAEQARTEALATLKGAAAAVDERLPAEADTYKRWLLDLAHQVAKAAKEGSFLGIGGQKVSAEEQATLAEIAEACNLQ